MIGRAMELCESAARAEAVMIDHALDDRYTAAFASRRAALDELAGILLSGELNRATVTSVLETLSGMAASSDLYRQGHILSEGT